MCDSGGLRVQLITNWGKYWGGMAIKHRLIAFLVSVSVILGSTLSVAAEWAATFLAPNSATGILEIKLPDNLDILSLTTLAVEIDDVDVTSLLDLNGTDFVYTPAQPFSPGEHQIRLISVADPSAPEEKGAWSFVISGASNVSSENSETESAPTESEIAAAEQAMTRGSFRVDTLTEFSYRFADKNISNQPDRAILGGAGDMSGEVESGNWRMSTRGNYLLQTDNDLSMTGNALDLGEYDITLDYSGETVKGGMTLGHHDIGQQSLIMNGFYRRGASLNLGSANSRIEGTGFAFGTESLTGGDNFTGLNSETERLVGGTVSVRPFSSDPDGLKVTGIYYDGKGSGIGDGIMITDPVAEGRGWGAIVEKAFGDQRVSLKGQYAQSWYDQDGDEGTAPEEDSQAMAFSIDARPFDVAPIWFGQSADLRVGAQYEQVGTYFQSLANNGLAGDRDAYTAYGNLYWGAFSSNLQYVYETNNVDDLETVPTDSLQNLSLGLNYTFDPQTGSLDWLGTPNMYLSGFIAEMGRVDTPAGYLGPDTDNITTSLTLGGNTSYGNWSWGLSHTLSTYADRTGESSDTINNGTGINLNWTDYDRFSIGGGAQLNVFEDRDTNKISYGTNFYTDISAEIMKDTLNLNMDYNLNLAAGSDDLPDTHLLNGEVEWTFLQSEPNVPGVALAVGGSMESTNGNTDSSEDQTAYQVFFVIRVKAPFAYDY